MKSSTFFRHAERQRGETVAFASLGLAGAVMILFAAWSTLNFVAGSDRVVAVLSGSAPTIARSATDPKLGGTNVSGEPGRILDAARPWVSNTPGLVPTAGLGSSPGTRG